MNTNIYHSARNKVSSCLSVSQKNYLLVLSFFLLSIANSLAQVKVTTDVAIAKYEAGNSAQFVISSSTSGMATYTLKYDNYTPVIATGNINIVAGQSYFVNHTEALPGVVICEVQQSGSTSVATAAFSPYEIMPLENAPSDLDAFWTAKKNELATVPMNPVLTPHSSTIYSTTYSVQFDHLDGRKIYGYLSVPVGVGPFPAVVTLPPYGSVANITVPETELAERAGVLSLSLSIHNVEPTQVDPNAYIPDDYTDPDLNYYKYGLLGAIRGIDYLFSRSDFDGAQLGITGISQGGGLAMNLAGIDSRVNLLICSVPALSQNAGLAHNKAGGFPNYVFRSRNNDGTTAHENSTIDATRYYDAMFHASKFNFPVMMNTSYQDMVTPMATGLAAFSQMPKTAPRVLYHSIGLGHNSPPTYFTGRNDFIHQHFPSSVATTPWPYNNNTGYGVDAGNDAITSVGSDLMLAATISNNTSTNPNYELEWEKISGPGTVIFSAENNYSTTANFSIAGTYVIKFTGNNTDDLASQNIYYSLSDYVTVTVAAASPLPVELVSFSARASSKDILLQWNTASEINHFGFEIQRRSEEQTDFDKIGWMEKMDNTTSGTYQFLDENVERGITYYYRLKQIDLDQTFSFSNIVSEKNDFGKLQISVFPNPVFDKMNMQLSSDQTQNGNLELFSSTGVSLYFQKIKISDALDLEVEMSHLPKGVYFLKVNMKQGEIKVVPVFKR